MLDLCYCGGCGKYVLYMSEWNEDTKSCEECTIKEANSAGEDYLRGHKIEWFGGKSDYADTKEPTVNSWKQRGCGHCGMSDTEEGHDGCLGTLPGVMKACCGHGKTSEAYVQLLDGVVIDGEAGAAILNNLKGRS